VTFFFKMFNATYINSVAFDITNYLSINSYDIQNILLP